MGIGGLGGDIVASLWASSMLKRQQKVEDDNLPRNRTRYKAAKDEYRRCQALGIPGRRFHDVAREYGIPSAWLYCFNRGEYQEGLDSTDADHDSYDKESSRGDF